MRNEANWVTVLKNYRLMKNAHYEGDAQNWHIVGIELFNSKFNLRSLRSLRIYLHQPSPSWLENTLRNICVYARRMEPLSSQDLILQSALSSSSSYLNRPGTAQSNSSGKGGSSGTNGGNAFD